MTRPAARPVRDPDPDHQLPRPQRPIARARPAAHLAGGADLALVTDAGTPLVSDPGEGIVARLGGRGWRGRGHPGRLRGHGGRRRERRRRVRAGRSRASCPAAAASAANAWPGSRPTSGEPSCSRRRTGWRPRWVTWSTACGTDRPAAVCRELTKLHESILRSRLGDLAAQAADGTIPARGEVVIVVGWRARRARHRALVAATVPTRAMRGRRRGTTVERLVSEGVARGEAARRVAAETGLPRRALYGLRAEGGARGRLTRPQERGPAGRADNARRRGRGDRAAALGWGVPVRVRRPRRPPRGALVLVLAIIAAGRDAEAGVVGHRLGGVRARSRPPTAWASSACAAVSAA